MDTIQMLMIGIWVVVLISTIFIEFESPQLVSIWFSVGAVVALIMAAFNLHYLWQIATFVIVSMILILLTRPLSKRFMKRDIIKTNVSSLIGQQGTILKEVSLNQRGEVQVQTRIWTAFTLDNVTILQGEIVRIVDIEGNKLLVEPIRKEE